VQRVQKFYHEFSKPCCQRLVDPDQRECCIHRSHARR
jgi:hypothetical protein